MSVIGMFTPTKEGGWSGTIRTLIIDAKLRFVPNDNRDSERAPAFKLYNPQNTTVRPNTVLGQKLTVNYVIEKTSGRVHAAWVLNSEEAALKRDRADNGFWSGLFK